ncbi:uncharacterized protein LOC114154330 isoform X2 [Xiphophorus couchianus]|uniref:uncharacterized protein LOC114154330 isoform X2 n=1 Tax=Xiphophorus couchianus TaxID=32473 RepID=UPI0010163564|nr:uncharacterized protein LOC114154330 isoform X2 [Xiphophorus couchianus]
MKKMVAMDGEPNLNDDINYVQFIFVSFWSYLVGFHGYQPPGYATNTHRHRFLFFPLVLLYCTNLEAVPNGNKFSPSSVFQQDGKSRLQQTQEEVEQVKDITKDNMEKADERSGKLNDLEQQAEDLLEKGLEVGVATGAVRVILN